MRIKFAFEFNAGVIDIPGENKIIGKGVFPLITYLDDPREHVFSETELLQMVEEIQNWMKDLGLTKEVFLKLASDAVRANVVGLYVLRVAEIGYDASVLYHKFLIIFWLLDDILDQNFENIILQSEDNNIFTVLYSVMHSIWNHPTEIQKSLFSSFSNFSSVQFLLAAWKSLVVDLKAQFPSYNLHNNFIEALRRYLSNFSWMGKNNREILSSEFSYRIARRHLSFMDGLWEFAAVLCGAYVSNSVREHRYFSSMLAAFGDIVSFENDIMSLQKELVEDESYNLLLVKVKQGASALEAMNETLRCVWDTTHEALKLAESLLELFPNEPELSSYIDLGINLVNGNPPIHRNMQRYIHLSGNTISLPQFASTDKQAEYIFKRLLKTKTSADISELGNQFDSRMLIKQESEFHDSRNIY